MDNGKNIFKKSVVVVFVGIVNITYLGYQIFAVFIRFPIEF